MKIKTAFLVGAFLCASALYSSPVYWDFPRDGNCHEGLAFSDGITGVLVWG
jgi:hypothetical protein